MPHSSITRGRAPNGTGQLIWREARQRWELRFSAPGTGCRTIGYYSVARFGSKRAAQIEGERKRRTLCGELAAGRLALSRGKTVADVVEECLARRSGQEDITIRGYENRAAHIKRHLGAVKLSKLTGKQIAAFYVALETTPQPPKNRPLRPKTIRHVIGVLNRALDLAVAQSELRGNPIRLERIRGPRLRKKMYQIFTAEEIECLLVGAREVSKAPWLAAVLTLLARCGLRPGEALALMRSDFRGDTLTIQRSIATLEVVKTDAGFRTIVIDPSVRHVVDAWLKTCPPSMWIFPGEGYPVIKLQQLDSFFARLLHRLHLRHRRPYDLRHTAITHAVAYARITDGVSLQDVAAWAGHSSSSITLDNYTHLLPINPGMVVTMARAYRTELFRIAEARAEGRQPGEIEDPDELLVPA